MSIYNRSKNHYTSNKSSDHERNNLPQLEVGNFVESAPMSTSVEHEERQGEREPYGYEEHFLLRPAQKRVDHFQAENDATDRPQRAKHNRMPFNYYPHPNDSK